MELILFPVELLEHLSSVTIANMKRYFYRFLYARRRSAISMLSVTRDVKSANSFDSHCNGAATLVSKRLAYWSYPLNYLLSSRHFSTLQLKTWQVAKRPWQEETHMATLLFATFSFKHAALENAMFITRSTLFRFSKSIPHAPSLSLKPSRVTFASSPNSSEWRNAAEGTRDARGNWTYDSAEAKRKADEVSERAKETASEGVDLAKDQVREAKDRTKEYAQDAKEKTKDAAGSVRDSAESAKEKAKEYAYETKDSAKEAAGTAAEKGKEGAEWTKKKTEEVAASTGETLKNVGEKAKQGVQGAWDAAKDTTQKIKETLVGKDDDDDNDGYGRGRGRGGLKDDNDDVAELKRRVGKSYGEKGY
ncbi:hypothetical protein VNO80_28693 [Phaseolus coccineus]|uniref:Uncharacterized protein n=1 Tax=Phaseolus coccineus TaxID=3886 RepID=A0AAN9LD16_PHACN